MEDDRTGETYCPAAAWSNAVKLSLSRFWALRLSDLEDEGMVARKDGVRAECL